MRHFRINRTNTLLLGLVMAGACGVSYGADVPLKLQNEDVVMFSSMQVSKIPGGSQTGSVTTLRTTAATLCGRSTSTAPGTNFVNQINPSFPGYYAGGDFKFGTINGGAQAAVPGIGFWNYRPTGLTMASDPETVCYVLDATGVRKSSSGLFTDTFDNDPANDASITTSVVSLPNFNSNLYTYYIDIRIPASFAHMKYAVRDGFDSTVFAVGRHCPPQAIGATQCDIQSMVLNSVDYIYEVPVGGVAQRFIVQRQLLGGAQMPTNTSAPLTYAALFFADGAETNLANNVSAGRGTLSDMLPTIAAQTNMVPNLAEGTGATNLSFVIADDTAETTQQLSAAVKIDFNGNLVNATNVSCAQIEAPQAGEAVRRTCKFDIPVFDPDFATDSDPATPGTYAPGVHASVLITATDSRGQESTKSVAFHAVASENDAPSFGISPLAVEDPDKVPTLVCSVSASPVTDQCAGSIQNFVSNLRPGPANAADENASQGVFLGAMADNKLNCWGDMGIFLSIGSRQPKYVFNGSRIDLDYFLNGTTGVVMCAISAGDYNFPSTHTYRDTTELFRIRVIP
jgi:hypothetical protein